MCLLIDKNKHPFLQSKVTLTPIIVYKVLWKHNLFFETPYQRKIIEFVNGKCILRSKLVKDDKYTIGKGIHAYRYLAQAWDTAQYLNTYLSESVIVVKAIIPKFSNYYIGYDGDIVSNKMIITDEVR